MKPDPKQRRRVACRSNVVATLKLHCQTGNGFFTVLMIGYDPQENDLKPKSMSL